MCGWFKSNTKSGGALIVNIWREEKKQLWNLKIFRKFNKIKTMAKRNIYVIKRKVGFFWCLSESQSIYSVTAFSLPESESEFPIKVHKNKWQYVNYIK